MPCAVFMKKAAVKKKKIAVRPKKKTDPLAKKRKLVIGMRKKKIAQRKPRKISPPRRIQPISFSLAKSPQNPIIMPRPNLHWESGQTFNPAAVLVGDTIHFLYRAIGSDGVSRLGYAASVDGVSICDRPLRPAYQHAMKIGAVSIVSYASGGSWGGAEDPRLTRVGDENVLYMTYTACDGGLRVGLTSIKIDDFLKKRWKWKPPVFLSPPGEVHKNWVIFPEKIKGKYAVLHSVSPKISIAYFDSLTFDDSAYITSHFANEPRRRNWDYWIRGAGPTPVKTKYGWLLLYHAMGKERNQYKVGAMLLDLNNPAKILYRSREPILAPDQRYENEGFKSGVVYASGAIIKDDQLYVYYGGADSVICVATAPLEEFLQSLMKGRVPQLKKMSSR